MKSPNSKQPYCWAVVVLAVAAPSCMNVPDSSVPCLATPGPLRLEAQNSVTLSTVSSDTTTGNTLSYLHISLNSALFIWIKELYWLRLE